MAKKEEVEILLDLLEKNNPRKAFEEINKSMDGVLAALSYLKDNKDKDVKSKDISQFMGVSSARMAVLLKKMINKGLVTKSSSTDDSRITIISITEKGLKIINKINNNIVVVAEKIVDEIGLDEITRTFNCLERIKSIVLENIYPERKETVC